MRATWMLLSTLGLAGVAHAVDVDPLDPAGSVPHDSGSPSVESPVLTGKGLSAGAMAHVAEDLVTRTTAAGDLERTVPHVFASTLYGGWTFEDKLRIEAMLPIYWHTRNDVSGEDPFGGAAAGDLIVQGNIRLRQNESGSFGVSLIPAIGVPTGRPKALLARGVHGKLKVALGGEIRERYGYAANVGFVLQRGEVFEELAVGSSVRAGAAAWVRLEDRFRVGADYDVAIGTSNAPGARNLIAQASLFGQVTNEGGFGLTAGVGRGLLLGVGAPRYRVFAALTYAQLVRDTDKDGLLDPDDACPIDPEDPDGFEDADGCPDVDNDEDGLLDVDDTCPNEAEDYDDFEDVDGCPDLDNDQDGLPDTADACMYRAGAPDLAGCPDTDGDGLADDSPLPGWDGWSAVTDGGYAGPVPVPLDQCPADPGPDTLAGCPDSDEDGVPDYRDACPDVKRQADEAVERSNGCPRTAFVQGDRVTITDRVLFETNRATIRPESFGLLNEVVSVLEKNPQIVQLEVAGHTDNVGSDRFNMGLSKRRAAAVQAYLVENGIDAGRLTSEGYGETEPIAVNFTESGRQANRRVEFRILEQTEVTEEVETDLGSDVGGLTVRLPMPYALLEIDGEPVSPRAPVRSLILQPGGHIVRVSDPRRGLDFTEGIDVEAGTTVTLEVPADAMSGDGMDVVTPDMLPDVPPPPMDEGTVEPVEEGAPLALPVEEGSAMPAVDEDSVLPAPDRSDSSDAPDAPSADDSGEAELRSLLPAAPSDGDDPDAFPVETGAPLQPLSPDAPAEVPPADEAGGEDAPVDGAPTFGDPADEVITGPGFGSSSGEASGPGFGSNVDEDPKEARKRAKREAREARRAAKRAEKERKKAEKQKGKQDDEPPPLLDPSTLPPSE